MKKRCTNSNCRKVFNVEASGGCCPHCGRRYAGITVPGTDAHNTRASFARFNGEGYYFTVRTKSESNMRNMTRKVVLDNYCVEVRKLLLAMACKKDEVELTELIREDLYSIKNLDRVKAECICLIVRNILTKDSNYIPMYYTYDAATKKLKPVSISGSMVTTMNEWAGIPNYTLRKAARNWFM